MQNNGWTASLAILLAGQNLHNKHSNSKSAISLITINFQIVTGQYNFLSFLYSNYFIYSYSYNNYFIFTYWISTYTRWLQAYIHFALGSVNIGL